MIKTKQKTKKKKNTEKKKTIKIKKMKKSNLKIIKTWKLLN